MSEEYICENCERPVEAEEELTKTRWHGWLCEDCVENEVWK